VLALAVLALAGMHFAPNTIESIRTRRMRAFERKWISELANVMSPKQVGILNDRIGEGRVDCRKFPDGSWVAVAWHSIHDGGALLGEWDAVVLRDSTGREFQSHHHFCGYEGFEGEFNQVPAKSAAELIDKLDFSMRRVR